jgi:serine/threonine-protein kinase
VTDRLIACRYRLERLLGTGAMSQVWAAEDLELGRTVAVKLRSAGADDARFDREARAAAALSHPNLCAIYDYGGAGGDRFIVLEYLSGGSLDDRLAPGKPLPDDETRRVAVEIAAGLAHAHARGVVHRDLKPANILFDAQGHAKIADFGIARMDDATGFTAVGTVLGTAAYISPEQVAGHEATPASDVYSFGVILFRMLTGRLPFESSDAIALASMHRDLPAPSVLEFRPDAPALLETVAAAALAKSPADRPRDGRALVDQLGHPRPSAEETAATEIFVPPARRRRNRMLLVAAGILVAAAGIGLALAVTFTDGTTTNPSSTPATTRPASTPIRTETSTAASTEATTAPATTAETTTTAETFPTTATVPTTVPATTAPATTAVPPATTTAPATTTTPVTTEPTTTAATTTAETTTATAPTTTTALQETTTTGPG